MDVDEQNIEDLFADDPPSDIGEEDDELEMRGRSAQETSLANLELGDGDRGGNLNSTTNDDTGTSTSKVVKPKRTIAKQPLLNADRILGKRGIRVLEKMFEDFEPREGKEFEDLDIVVKRMKHWAHRLYPKLPFDDVTKQISHVGKKMQIQTNLKKIRMGMDVDPYFDNDIIDKEFQDDPDSDGQNPQNEEDGVERYDNDPQEDVFEQLIREGDEKEKASQLEKENVALQSSDSQTTLPAPHQQENAKPSLTEEQKERMLKNRQLAEERRKQKQNETSQSLQESSLVINDSTSIVLSQ